MELSPTEAIAAVEGADTPAALVETVRTVAERPTAETAPLLIRVLGFNNPGAAVAAVDGLVRLGEPAVVPLLEQLDGYNYGARAWAIRALAAIGDPRGQGVLLEAAGDFSLSVRRAAARGLGFLAWEKLPPSERAAARERSRATLLYCLQDNEWVVRYAAVVGLERLAADGKSDRAAVKDALERAIAADETPGVVARARLALQRLTR